MIHPALALPARAVPPTPAEVSPIMETPPPVFIFSNEPLSYFRFSCKYSIIPHLFSFISKQFRSKYVPVLLFRFFIASFPFFLLFIFLTLP